MVNPGHTMKKREEKNISPALKAGCLAEKADYFRQEITVSQNKYYHGIPAMKTKRTAQI